MTMPFAAPSAAPFAAAAVSEHPDLAEATGEVVGQILEKLRPPGDDPGSATPPDLAVLFVTSPHREHLAEAAKTVRAALAPRTLLGVTAESVVGPSREVEHAPGVALWVGRTGPVTPFHVGALMTPDGPVLTGVPELAPDTSGVVLIGDPFSFPVEVFLQRLERDHPGLPLIGGMALGGQAPGQNRLVVDDQVMTSGAVGVLLGPSVRVTTVVSQGCRPVGNPLVVTKAEGNVVYELAGKPPLERLGELAEAMPEEERAMLYQGVHLGRVIDEHKADFGRGDFLIRNVLGGDPRSGAIQVGDQIEVGATTQFQVRDAESADEDLRQLLADHTAEAALLFTCNGRGSRLFGSTWPDHDATVVTKSLDGAPVAGMFCAGEIGPVGRRNFLHGFTASVLLLSPAV